MTTINTSGENLEQIQSDIDEQVKKELIDEISRLYTRKQSLEEREQDIRKQRNAQAECIGRLSFQGEDEAVKTHQEKMYELGSDLEKVRKQIEQVDQKIKLKINKIMYEASQKQ